MTNRSLKPSPVARASARVLLIAGLVMLSGCSTLGLGNDEAAPAYEKALTAHVTRHWTPDLYSGDPAGIVVTARLQMNQDGTVAGDPELTIANNGGQTDAIVQAYVDSVRLAITRSLPFPLAADDHANWRVIELRFNLKEDSGK